MGNAEAHWLYLLASLTGKWREVVQGTRLAGPQAGNFEPALFVHQWTSLYFGAAYTVSYAFTTSRRQCFIQDWLTTIQYVTKKSKG